MCLGIPGQVVELADEDGVRFGKVSFGGVSRRVCLDHVRDAVVGDWVLVHVGFALSRLDQEDAARTLALLAELGELESGEVEP